MYYALSQIILPFILSCLIVIIITIIAEQYGTKIGGILGTLPSTIVIAFIFIGLNEDTHFASNAAVVVPAEMGVNIIFLFVFSLLASRSSITALFAAVAVWTILSSLFLVINLNSIIVSVAIYFLIMISVFFYLEKTKKVKSKEKVSVIYTPLKLAFRGIFAGSVIALSVTLANISDILSGIVSVFPAIFLSTMVIFMREHGPEFTGGMGKAMILGTMSVMTYSVFIHFLYPETGIIYGTIIAYFFACIVTLCLFYFRKKIS